MATMAIAETVDSDGVQIEFLVEFPVTATQVVFKLFIITHVTASDYLDFPNTCASIHSINDV